MIPRNIGSMIMKSDSDGIIFDIQRYSIHDGPGISTIIFFKGCTLDCLWCSNPEGKKPGPDLTWNEHNCIHCEKCEILCPNGAIKETEKGLKIIDRKLCNYCGICDENCYANAMQLCGRYVSADEVISEVKKDTQFYLESGGGVTLSGGEPLAQPEFALKLLKGCKKNNLNTCVETAGHVPWENFESLAKYVDLFLYDIKLIDPIKHQECVGVSNELILENARRLSNINAKLLIRVPVIPEYNDDEENIKIIAQFTRELKSAQGLELLPYHKFGSAKWRRLDQKYLLEKIQPPPEHVMKMLRELAKIG